MCVGGGVCFCFYKRTHFKRSQKLPRVGGVFEINGRGYDTFCQFLNFHQIFHRFTLHFGNTSFQVLKAWNIVYENMKNPQSVGLQGLYSTYNKGIYKFRFKDYLLLHLIINTVSFHIEWWRRKNPGGHSNSKRGYQAHPWTHKKHPNHVFFRYENRP